MELKCEKPGLFFAEQPAFVTAGITRDTAAWPVAPGLPLLGILTQRDEILGFEEGQNLKTTQNKAQLGFIIPIN